MKEMQRRKTQTQPNTILCKALMRVHKNVSFQRHNYITGRNPLDHAQKAREGR
jgi:hypothetical protein